MSFTPKVWANDAAGNTPVTAAELARMELGIDQAYGRSANSIANSAVTAETVLATWDIPANTLGVADLLQVRAFGQVSSTATLSFRVRFGTAGTTADALVATFSTTGAGAANQHWSTNILVATLTSTTMTGSGQVQLNNLVLGPTVAAFAAATMNLAVANKLSLTVTQSAAQTCTTRAASIGWIG